LGQCADDRHYRTAHGDAVNEENKACSQDSSDDYPGLSEGYMDVFDGKPKQQNHPGSHYEQGWESYFEEQAVGRTRGRRSCEA